MVILGLTGSIGMGKSTAARAFRRLGVPVHDADRAVHTFLSQGGTAVDTVATAFPDTVHDGVVDRGALGQRVFSDAEALMRLEGILHPLVRADEQHFLRAAAGHGHQLVVLDVPLLLETGGEHRCDAVVVVSAPAFVQRERVLRRPEMTVERLDSILSVQMSDAEKRRRADFVVATGLDHRFSLRAIEKIVTVIRQWRGRHWPLPTRRVTIGTPRRSPVLRHGVSGHRNRQAR